MQDYTILLVDDEEDVLEFLGYNLRKEGFDVHTCSNGTEAIIKAKEVIPHLIILDVMMPDLDGIETCREIKQISSLENTIITFLTARGEDYSQIAGFEAGADDYITKPIKPRLLISKVHALLRRHNPNGNKATTVTEFGDIVIDKERYLVIKKGEEINLPKKEFEILLLLSSKPDRVFVREEIFEYVWGNDVVVGGRTLDVHIRKLREKIGGNYIKTVKGVGYKFEA